jgi:Mn-dependent DtxR family transcriptional regulator
MEKPLDEKLERILVHFKRQGGTGHITDMQRAAGTKTADRFAKKLIALGLVHHVTFDRYDLTPAGHDAARELIAAGA